MYSYLLLIVKCQNLQGDIFSKTISMESGAIFNGNCKMGDSGNIKTSTETLKTGDTSGK